MRWWGAAVVVMVLGVACHDSDGDPLYCYEFQPGETITFRDPPSARTLEAVQVAADVIAIVSVEANRLAGACRRIADANGANPADITLADEVLDPDKRVRSMCELAEKTVRTTAPALAPIVCTPTTSDRQDCTIACPDCGAVCDMNARAKANCVGPDPKDFSDIAAIGARLQSIADVGPAYSAATDDFVDFKAACIPVVIAGINTALSSATSGAAVAKAFFEAKP